MTEIQNIMQFVLDFNSSNDNNTSIIILAAFILQPCKQSGKLFII
jgi:hypothetical protein